MQAILPGYYVHISSYLSFIYMHLSEGMPESFVQQRLAKGIASRPDGSSNPII